MKENKLSVTKAAMNTKNNAKKNSWILTYKNISQILSVI